MSYSILHLPHRVLRLAAACSLTITATVAPAFAAQPEPPAAPAPAPIEFMRTVESEDGRKVRLEMVIRTFAPAEGAGPTVDLVGAVHIGDASFYERLQQHLDARDVVLFEGVKPGAVGGAITEDATDEQRAAQTRKRIRLLAALTESFRETEGAYPESIEALATGSDRRISWLVSSAAKDGWGAPIAYTVEAPKAGDGAAFDIVSLGADAAPGGEGAAADIAFSAEPPLTEAERISDDPGIQQQLAKALGLVFQLDAMDHSGANWRNSDMTVDQLQERLDAAGADASVLLKTLDGSSLQGKMLGLVLRFIGMSPMYSAMGKVMLVEMLSQADQLMEAAPGEMGKMMGVIIVERNRVVLDDLRALLDSEPDIKAIGIIYGAGHLADLQARLTDEFEYRVVSEVWVPAIEIDLDKAGIPPSQAKQLRTMLRRSIDQQLKALERRRERQEKRSGDR
jgi:hypothetical protein